jgi:hypothetical protein
MKNFFVCCILFLNGNLNAQVNTNKSLDDCLSIFPNGYLIKAYPYTFDFNDELKVHLTFNDVPLGPNMTNSFVLTSTQNGNLKLFSISSKNDTILVAEKFLRFREPSFSTVFMGKGSGGTINKKDLKNKVFAVEILNSDISISIPIIEATVQFYKDGELKNLKIVDGFIADKVADEIINSSSDILVLNFKIKFGKDNIQLTPSIYYLQ